MSEVDKKSKISEVDFDAVATYIYGEYLRRKKDRKWLHEKMRTIDRQLRIKPSVKYKADDEGNAIKNNKWMPECELPNQSQTLELLCSEARKMMFPDNGPFFKAKAYSSDEFLNMFKNNAAFIVGSEIDAPSIITSENVNMYVQGFLSDALKQFNHDDAWDLINSEAFKYGVGVGRIRMASKSVFIHDSTNTYDKSKKIPILVPIPLKNVYLDDKAYDYMAHGASVGPSVILKMNRKYADLMVEAKNGNKDDTFMSGGWLTKNIAEIEPDKNGFVELLEYEGDIVFPKNGDEDNSVLVPNAIITVLCGKNGGDLAQKVIRVQYNELPSSSYIIVPYQKEHIDCPYGTSPLIKGEPIQTVASESLNRYMQAAILSTQPPVQYDKDDQYFKSKGGPKIFPSATWASSGDIKVHQIGNPAPLLAGYQAFLGQYSDVTGITAARLGAQTVSHTTAYAKDKEIEKGTLRTVDYVRAVMKTPMVKWLSMAYYLAKKQLGDNVVQAYMEEFGSYVNVKSDMLPDIVCFEALGSIAPQESIARQQQRLSAMMQAIQLNQLAVQSGLAQPLNYEAIQRQLLREAGITDVDALTTNPQGDAGTPAIQGVGQGSGNSNAIPIALQGLQQGIQ